MRTFVLALVLALAGLAAFAAAGASAKGVGSSICAATGDTHVSPLAGGKRFNIYSGKPYRAVEYADMKNPANNFVVHVLQKYGRWGRHSTNNDYAIRCGRDHVKILYARKPTLPTVEVNGRKVDIYKLGTYQLPSAPEPRAGWTLKKGDMKTAQLTLNCGHGQTGPSTATYAHGFKMHMRWYNWNNGNARMNAHGALHVEVENTYKNKLQGACGWITGGRQPGSVNHLIDPNRSLFALKPQDHAAAAKAGGKVSDPKNLAKQTASCTKKLEAAIGVKVGKTYSWFKRVDRDVPKEMKNFIKGCAVDEYYGLPFTYDVVKDQVCGWIKIAQDAVQKELVKAKGLIKGQCAAKIPDVVAMLTLYTTEKFELSRLCNKSPPKKPDALPKFPPCPPPTPPPPPPKPPAPKVAAPKPAPAAAKVAPVLMPKNTAPAPVAVPDGAPAAPAEESGAESSSGEAAPEASGGEASAPEPPSSDSDDVSSSDGADPADPLPEAAPKVAAEPEPQAAAKTAAAAAPAAVSPCLCKLAKHVLGERANQNAFTSTLNALNAAQQLEPIGAPDCPCKAAAGVRQRLRALAAAKQQ